MTARSALTLSCAVLLLSACAGPRPYEPPTQPAPSEPPETVETQPGSPPTTVEPPQPLPPPAPREPVLSPASRALVDQAQAQLVSKNYAVAAGSIERALRIEPDNALLWIELAKVRAAEGNYAQAENLARKAISLSTHAPRAQARAWDVLGDVYRAQGKNNEARDAELKADSLLRR